MSEDGEDKTEVNEFAHLPDFSQLPESAMRGLIDAAIEISKKRRETLRLMKAARLRGDIDEVLKRVDELCGIESWHWDEIKKASKKKVTKKKGDKK